MASQIGAASGSNPGGVYMGKDGKQRYVKLYTDPAQAHGEHLANSIYNGLGMDAPKSLVFKTADGKWAYASEIIPGGKTLGTTAGGVSADNGKKLLKGFVADVLTGNWDAVGTGHDNVVLFPGGKMVRIDNGGTFLMRAQFGRKPEHVLNQVTEWEGFFNPTLNPYYSALANKAGVYKAEDVPDLKGQWEAIKALRDKAGGWEAYVTAKVPGLNAPDKAKIVAMLDARSTLLESKIQKAEQAAQKPAAKPAPAPPVASAFAPPAAVAVPTPPPPKVAPTTVMVPVLGSPAPAQAQAAQTPKVKPAAGEPKPPKKGKAPTPEFVKADGTPVYKGITPGFLLMSNGAQIPNPSACQYYYQGDAKALLAKFTQSGETVIGSGPAPKASLSWKYAKTVIKPEDATKAAATLFGKLQDKIPPPTKAAETKAKPWAVAPAAYAASMARVDVANRADPLEILSGASSRMKTPAGQIIPMDASAVEHFGANFRTEIDDSGKPMTRIRLRLTEGIGEEALGRYAQLARNGQVKDDLFRFQAAVLDSDTGLLRRKKGEYSATGVGCYKEDLPGKATMRFFHHQNAMTEIGVYNGAMRGVVEITVPGSDPKAALEAYRAGMKNLGVADPDAKPDPAAVERYKKAKLITLWDGQAAADLRDVLRRGKRHDDAVIDRHFQRLAAHDPVVREILDDAFFAETEPGHMGMFSPRLAEYLRAKTGIGALYHESKGYTFIPDMVDPRNMSGLLASTERFSRGQFAEGMSTDSDFRTGGADGLFTRVWKSGQKQRIYNYGPVMFVLDPNELGRMDWWAHSLDLFGTTSVDATGARMTATDMTKRAADGYSVSNEVCLQRGVPTRAWRRIVVHTEEARGSILAGFAERGITEINGVPVQEFVMTHAYDKLGMDVTTVAKNPPNAKGD